MNKIFKFNWIYFTLTILLFATEVFIAKYVHDTIIRPYGGDFLVVILIYCFVKSFVDAPVFKTAIGVLLFSYLIETLQYFHFVNRVGLSNNRIASLVIGVSFEWTDILSYTLGILLVLLLENIVRLTMRTRNSKLKTHNSKLITQNSKPRFKTSAATANKTSPGYTNSSTEHCA